MDLVTRDDEPGAFWGLGYLRAAQDEALKILNSVQYAHTVDQFEQLAMEDNPAHSAVADIKPIEGFYELRDKGGVFGKINLRVFFAIDKESRMLVVLGAYKKEDEDQTPPYVVSRMRHRQRIAEEALKGAARKQKP